MSSGTKITLAVIALFVGVIIVYYGFVMPAGEPDASRVQDPIARTNEADREPMVASNPGRKAGADSAGTLKQPESGDSADDASRRSAPPLPTSEPDLGMLTAVPDPDPAPERALPPDARDDPVDPRDRQPSDVATSPKPEPSAAPNERREREATAAPSPGSAARGSSSSADVPETPRNSSRPQPNRPANLASPPPPGFTEYAVKEGDTLYAIAEQWFGDASRWDLITEANPDLDPRRLRVGQTLRLPSKDSKRNTVAGDDGRTHTVRSGDTLSSIAKAVYGEERLWRRIYVANRTAIGPSPDELTVGMRLRIPPRP